MGNYIRGRSKKENITLLRGQMYFTFYKFCNLQFTVMNQVMNKAASTGESVDCLTIRACCAAELFKSRFRVVSGGYVIKCTSECIKIQVLKLS